MTESGGITPLVALVAGMLSFASPCVFPLIPAYLSYLGGQATRDGAPPDHWAILANGVFFVMGFSAVFVGLGAAASAIGRLLFAYLGVLTKVGGIAIVLFGLHHLGLLKIPLLYTDTRRHYRRQPGLGYASSVLMGVFFGAGWSPCIGPTLGAILTLALNEGTVSRGALLLFVYSMGLGIPFLLMALLIDRTTGILQRARRLMRAVTVASGVFLVILGMLVFFDRLGWLTQWISAFEPIL